jgi:hypothetical protein
VSEISDAEWETVKRQIRRMLISQDEKLRTLEELAKQYRRTITERDIQDITT